MRFISRFSIFIAGVLLSFSSGATEFNDTLQIDNQTRIDSLEQRIASLESSRTTWQKFVEKLPHISGYLQTGYNYNSFGNGLSTFQVKRLRLVLDGYLTPKAFYKFQFEAFNGINVGGRWEKQKLFQVLDAFAEYRFSPAFTLRAGQFSTPAGYENYAVSPLTNTTIDYAAICTRMVLRNAVGYSYSDFGRDLGVMLMGSFAKAASADYYHFDYNLALTNGHLPTVNDNNKSKDIIAALTYHPVKDLNLKASYNWGEYSPDTFSGSLNNDAYPWNTVTSHYVPLHRVIIGAWWKQGQWDIRSEYGHLSSSKNGVKLVNENAFYIMGAFQIKKWQPVARFDIYRDKINPSLADNRERYLLGCNFIANKHIKIQLNYILSHYTEQASESTNNGHRYSNELLLMGLFSF